MLSQPTDNLLKMADVDINFMYCWANESWTRAWDGKTGELILHQDYSAETWSGMISDFEKAFRDRRYIRVGGKPVVLLYQVDQLDYPKAQLSALRTAFQRETGEDIHLGTVYCHGLTPEMAALVDFIVEFPPHRLPRRKKVFIEMEAFEPALGDRFEAYNTVVDRALSSLKAYPHLYPGVCPDWDNSPRRPEDAFIVVGSTPEKFRKWVDRAARAVLKKYKHGDVAAPFLFVNAWNEWAEGAFLEPSERWGTRYLDALRMGAKRSWLKLAAELAGTDGSKRQITRASATD